MKHERRRFLQLVFGSCASCVTLGCSRAGSSQPHKPRQTAADAGLDAVSAALPTADPDPATPRQDAAQRDAAVATADAAAVDAGNDEDGGSMAAPALETKLHVPLSHIGSEGFVRVRDVLIGRDALGLYALSAVCPHEGCLVDPPTGQVSTCPGAKPQWLVCMCHCSLFDAQGRVRDGPAVQDLPHFQLSVDGDEVVVDRAVIVSNDTRTAV